MIRETIVLLTENVIFYVEVIFDRYLELFSRLVKQIYGLSIEFTLLSSLPNLNFNFRSAIIMISHFIWSMFIYIQVWINDYLCDFSLTAFTGNGDVSKWVKNSRVGQKTPNKQTNILSGETFDYGVLKSTISFRQLVFFIM